MCGYLSILQFSITIIIFEATCFCLNILKLIIFTNFYILFDIKLLFFRNMTSNQLFQIWRDQQHCKPLSSKLNVVLKKVINFFCWKSIIDRIIWQSGKKIFNRDCQQFHRYKKYQKNEKYLSPQISEHKK